MAKQVKVSRKIKDSLAQIQDKTSLANARKNPNDECYTHPIDILNELSYWAEKGKFVGKNIICPCDWDIVEERDIYSITITYKDLDVEVVGNNVYKAVKKVSYKKYANTNYANAFDLTTAIPQDTPQLVTIDLAEDEIEDFLANKLTCNFLRILTQNARDWGIKSITASGYDPALDKGIKFQDVDYSKYDICITNPPFSLYAEFMTCINGKIDFIILAPANNRITPSIALPLYLKQAYLGHGIELHIEFDNPTKENGYNGTKIVNCDWLTSYPEAQTERDAKHFRTGIKYEEYKEDFVEMPNMTLKDGTHPIRVSMSTYPEDYDGWMFACWGVLDKLDQTEYEWLCTNCKKYFNSINPEANPFSHKLSDGAMLKASDGKIKFHGILFRKKPTNKEGANHE